MRRRTIGWNALSWVSYKLRGIHSSPVPLFNLTLEPGTNLVDDEHLRECAKLLQKYAPAYYSRLFHGYHNSLQVLKRVGEEIEDYKQIKVNLVEVKGHLRGVTARYWQERIKRLFITSWEKLSLLQILPNILSVFLSLMVSSALLDIWEVDLTDLIGEEWLYVAFLICSAIGINLSVMHILSRNVYHRLLHRKSIDALEGTAIDLPFWEAFRRGDTTLYQASLLVLLEVLFTFPFIIGRLPYQLRDIPLFQGSLIIGVGYLAFLNVSLSWTVGRDQFFREHLRGRVRASTDEFSSNRNHDIDNEKWRTERQVKVLQAQNRRGYSANKQRELQYQKLWKQVLTCSRSWERSLPYLLDDMRLNGAPPEVVTQVATALANDHKTSSLIKGTTT